MTQPVKSLPMLMLPPRMDCEPGLLHVIPSSLLTSWKGKKIVQVFGTLHPYERPRCNSWSLTSASPFLCIARIFGVNQQMEDLPFPLPVCVSVSSSLYHFQTNKWVFRGISLTHIALPITVCYLFLIPSPPFPVVRYFLLQMAISFISLPLKVPCLCVRFSHTGASALAWLRPTLASTQVSALLWAMWTAMSNTECYGGKDDLSSRNQEDANAAGSSVRKHIK